MRDMLPTSRRWPVPAFRGGAAWAGRERCLRGSELYNARPIVHAVLPGGLAVRSGGAF